MVWKNSTIPRWWNETEGELGGPQMVDSNSAASVAGKGYHRDRSDEAELAVVEARRDIAAARKEKPAKLAATVGKKNDNYIVLSSLRGKNYSLKKNVLFSVFLFLNI